MCVCVRARVLKYHRKDLSDIFFLPPPAEFAYWKKKRGDVRSEQREKFGGKGWGGEEQR